VRGLARQLSPRQLVAGEVGTILFLLGSLSVLGAPLQILGLGLIVASLFFARGVPGAMLGLLLNVVTWIVSALLLGALVAAT
jgi:hypothetical protein